MQCRLIHAQCQNAELYGQLMCEQKCARIKRLPLADPRTLKPADRVFFVALVAFRLRSNMFHGKGVWSWLQYRLQIGTCPATLQTFVSRRVHAAEQCDAQHRIAAEHSDEVGRGKVHRVVVAST